MLHLRRIIGTACAIGLLAAVCTVTTPASTLAQTTKQTAGKKAAKKPAKKSDDPRGQPPARANATDRSIVPELHDARHGY